MSVYLFFFSLRGKGGLPILGGLVIRNFEVAGGLDQCQVFDIERCSIDLSAKMF